MVGWGLLVDFEDTVLKAYEIIDFVYVLNKLLFYPFVDSKKEFWNVDGSNNSLDKYKVLWEILIQVIAGLLNSKHLINTSLPNMLTILLHDH